MKATGGEVQKVKGAELETRHQPSPHRAGTTLGLHAAALPEFEMRAWIRRVSAIEGKYDFAGSREPHGSGITWYNPSLVTHRATLKSVSKGSWTEMYPYYMKGKGLTTHLYAKSVSFPSIVELRVWKLMWTVSSWRPGELALTYVVLPSFAFLLEQSSTYWSNTSVVWEITRIVAEKID